MMEDRQTTIGDFFEVKGGKRLPKGSSFAEGKTDYPYIRVTDFVRNGVKTNGIKFITQDIQEKIKRYTISSTDVFISIAGTIGIAGVIPKELDGANLTENAAKIIPKKGVKVCNKYLSYYLNSRNVQSIIASKTMAVGVPKLALFRIQEIPINLPPLETQRHIAQILDTADALRQKDQALLKQYDALAQSLFLEMFGDPVTNPKGWEMKKLQDVTIKIGSGATPKGGKEAYKTEGISLIRSLNVYDNKFKYKDLALIDDNQAKKLNNVIVKKQDVLFNITGASICRCTIVPSDVLPARVNQHVAIIRANQELLSPLFLNFLLISENYKIKLLNLGGKGGATREAITKDDLKSFPIIFPPITLQNQFAERIEAIEAQKAVAQQAAQASEALFQALLQRAFKGELKV